jgi:predicted nucleic-acid-binding protein
MENLQLLETVAALSDHPPIRRGQIGTVVEILEPDVFLVEFADENGETIATLPLRSLDLLRAHHDRPVGF